MRFHRSCHTLFFLALLAVASPILAFNPVDQSDWEIPRAGAPSQTVWEAYAPEETGAPVKAPIAAFTAQHGGTWTYQVNHRTGTYHHIYGSGIDLGRPLAKPVEVEALARNFISNNGPLFAVGNEDLKVVSNVNALGKWSIIFQQTYAGLRVLDGRCHLVFTQSGRLFEFGSDAHPAIGISPVPSVPEPEALAIAEQAIGFKDGSDEVRRSELLVLPVEADEAGMEYRLAYRFDLATEEPYGVWSTYVDANTGDILWRENLVRSVNFTGHSQGDVEWDGYCDGSTNDYPLRNMRITISTVGTAYTNANGDFTLSYGGTDSKSLSAEFRGNWVNVNRASGGDAIHTGTITPGVPYTIDWSNANSLASERDAFAYVNKVHDWLKAMDPAFTDLDYEMLATIERTDLYCPGNAWWDGTNINFCVQSTSYGNTARMGDVVYHEYGHGVTDYMYDFSGPPGDVHEGNSDFIANLLTRESIMGLGFYLNNCSSGIRNSDNTIQYPCGGEDHYCGQVIAGFHWDAWQGLLAAYPQAYADSVSADTWHFGRKMGLPQDMADQVHWTFVADDNDGNLSNGTPHYDQFCVAATNHGFTCPEITVGVSITHTPLGNTSNTTNPYPVTAVITTTAGSIVVDSCRVAYRADGGAFANAYMSATGNPDEYVGYIPAQQACTEVEYYIYARDTAGYSKTHPAGAPANLHAFLVGYDTVFSDDFETNKGWTAGVTGDNATTGIWQRCDPQGTAAQAEDDHTPAPGVNAYITHCAAGTSQGSYDVDGGKTTLLSPVFDLSDYAQASVVYYRWYSNDTGAEPGTDYWVVDATDDNGATWVNLENTNQSDRSWRLMQFDIGAYVDLTGQVRFRFIASDYDPGSLVEAGVDDFSIIACEEAQDTQPPSVAVLEPNGGEVIVGGSDTGTLIRWQSTDNVGVVMTHILLSTDGGTTYPDTIESGSFLDSTWQWFPPDIDEPDCRIKVVCLDAAANQGSDASDGNFTLVAVSGVPASSPARVVLNQNPDNRVDGIDIEFGLPVAQRVSIAIYSVEGRQVATLAEGVYPGGYHTATWKGLDEEGHPVSAGVYFCRMDTEGEARTLKVLVVR